MQKKKRQLLIFSSLVAMAFYALSVAFSDHEQITTQLKSFTLLQLCLIFGLSLVNYTIRFIRWHGYLNVLGHRIPLASNLMCYLAGFAFTTTPGKAGEAIRSVYLKEHDVGYKHSLAMLVTERILDVFAMLILAGLLIYLFDDFSWGFYLIAFLTVGLLFLLSTDQIMAKIRAWLNQRLQLTETTLIGHFLALVHQSLDLMKRRLLLGALFMGIVAWGAEGIAFYYILAFLNVDISLSSAVGIYAASMIAGAIT
ncbi:MAG: flippase-like domain-containing protein, partial [Gammaproteobacteria bacterium]|nr:flippase-like domain-containing protein [Gammaproteobacteria bacterium]